MIDDVDTSCAVSRMPEDGRSLEYDGYRAIFEHGLDGVLLSVPDGKILAANPAACQLLGRSEDQICAIGRQGLADPADSRWVTGLAERARTGRTRMQVRMLRPDGTSFEVDVSSAIFTGSDGQRRSVVIFRDLSERLALAQKLAVADDRDRIAVNLHRTVMDHASAASMLAHGLVAIVRRGPAGDRVRELVGELDKMVVDIRRAIFHLGSADERQYQTLVESSPVSVAVYRGRDAKFVYANQSAVDLYGAHDLADMLARYAYEVVPPDLMARWQQLAQRIDDGAVIRQDRFRLLRFDGKDIGVEVNATKVVFAGETCVEIELHDTDARTTD